MKNENVGNPYTIDYLEAGLRGKCICLERRFTAMLCYYAYILST